MVKPNAEGFIPIPKMKVIKRRNLRMYLHMRIMIRTTEGRTERITLNMQVKRGEIIVVKILTIHD